MAARRGRRIPADLKAIQDERLTCRHIQTLMQLQQITDENEDLKCKVQFLEKEVSSCQELHQIARDSEAQLEKLDKSWRLAAERQLNDLRSSYEKRYGELNAAKEEIRESGDRMKEEFHVQIDSLESENDALKKRLESKSSDEDTIKDLRLKLDEALSNANSSAALVCKMELEIKETKSKEDILTVEKVKYIDEISSLEKNLQEMSLKLFREEDSKRKLVEQSDLVRELEKQRRSIESLEKERETYEANIDELKITVEEYKQKLHVKENENKIIQLERDVLQQSSTDLQNEVGYLKEKEAGSRGDFREYVNMKRELIAVREENHKLRNAASKFEMKASKTDSAKLRKMNTKSISKNV